MKNLLILFILSFCFSLHAQVQEDRSNWSMNDYWEATKLDFEKLIYGTFTQKNCTESKKKLLGCVAAINKMQSLQEPDKNILIKIDLQNNNQFVKTELKDLNPKEFHEAYEAYLRALSLELENIKEATHLMVFNIEKMLTNFEKEYVTQVNDSMTASVIYNEFLQIAVDPHSYLTPKNYMDDRSRPSQDKKGMGIYFSLIKHESEDKYIITEVIRNSPAEESGLMKGDLIINANGTTTNEEIYEVISKQDPVHLNVLRKDEIKEITIIKGIYTVSQVEASLMYRNGKKYGYIKLRSFSDNTACKKMKALAAGMVNEEKVEGFILDLRNNGGGLVSQAQCIMEMYLENGSYSWMVKYLEDQKEVLVTQKLLAKNQILKDIHTVTLINGHSASASEALAMYLQDYRKSFILGERSFGKGSMQTIRVDRENSEVLKGSTVALYYGPRGISPQLRGVTPDIVSLPSFEQKEATPFMREEDRYTFPLKDLEINLSDYSEAERLQEVQTVTTCIETEGRKEFYYNRLGQTEKILFDNQLETAVDTIDCANSYIPIYRETELKKVDAYEYIDHYTYLYQQMLKLEPRPIPQLEIKP